MLEKFSLDDAHWKMLRLLEGQSPDQSARIGRSIGDELGQTNCCLKALLEKGLLKIQNFQSSKRTLAYAYAGIESLQQEINKAGPREKSEK